jgi:hypothetical protein
MRNSSFIVPVRRWWPPEIFEFTGVFPSAWVGWKAMRSSARITAFVTGSTDDVPRFRPNPKQPFPINGPDDTTLEVQRRVLAEDRPIVEAQRPERLPLDLSEEFHIRCDKFSTLYRTALVQIGLGQHFSA